MNTLWQINNLKAIILLYQIGFKNGLKEGDKPTNKEYEEVIKRHPSWITKLGHTELNKYEYIREMVSHGIKTLYIPSTNIKTPKEKEK